MSCDSAIYTVNTSSTEITPTSGQFAQIPFGSVLRRFRRNLRLEGGAIVACGSGYYDFDVDANLMVTAEGEIALQLYQDGDPVPGSLKTVSAAAGDYIQIHLNPLVRLIGECNSLSFTLGVNAACTPVNISSKVRKI